MKSSVFLSASIPYRKPEMYKPEPILIREAIRALVNVAVIDHVLVFGGHPAITPLVWDAAKSLDAVDSVVIYQSELYKHTIPEEARYFPNFIWTPIDLHDTSKEILREKQSDEQFKAECQKTMRDWMIKRWDGGKKIAPEYKYGFFIGGMEGVEDEWELFREFCPNAQAYPIASTEGAARSIWEKNKNNIGKSITGKLDQEIVYRNLFEEILFVLNTPDSPM